ncbi:MAG: glycosyltransferase family 2 protein [Chitinophagales bacterium]|nr:glycosyltransferase family 2 protein [Bacteroidota bacterium]MCB9043951.1 glycosyltransferase family 2 protein [Chitinophagales bacterium]
MKVAVSIIVPLLNEEESLPELHDWIVRVCNENNLSYEIIWVDDGSSDNSWKVIQALSQKNAHNKGIKFRRNYGKSAALNEGFARAQGEVVITMDADLQDNPDEIPDLYQMIQHEGFDLVSGWKKQRHDPWSKTFPSRFFNAVTRKLSGINLHDFNCGLKAYKKDVIKSIEVYGEMHRYIPLLAKWAGFRKIGEKVVQHQARKYGYSKFGIERLIKGFLDLLTILFIGKFGRNPMHLFGAIGTLSFLMGGGVTIWLICLKLWRIATKTAYRDVVDQPLFYIALMAIIVGVQLFLAGFIGELVNRNAPERNKYIIAAEV